MTDVKRENPYLADVMDVSLLAEMEAEGFVRRTQHPRLPLDNLNYTARAQYGREWNEVTEQCRGLVVSRQDNPAIVGRPFRKFFNVGEHGDGDDFGALPVEPFEVFDKLDGSLIVVSLYAGEVVISSRGSFWSDQAQAAGKLWRALYGGRLAPEFGTTWCFEYIAPWNRIVVDYGVEEKLVFLAAIDNATGEDEIDFERNWAPKLFECVKRFDALDDMDQIIAMSSEDGHANEEGFVVRFESGMRAKVKHAEYVRLHRLLTGVTAKTIYKRLGIVAMRDHFDPKVVARSLHCSVEEVIALDNVVDPIAELLEHVPDEFYQWVRGITERIKVAYDELVERVILDFGVVSTQLDPTLEGRERKSAFAEIVKDHPEKHLLFGLVDGKPIEPHVWRMLEPQYEVPFKVDDQ